MQRSPPTASTSASSSSGSAFNFSTPHIASTIARPTTRDGTHDQPPSQPLPQLPSSSSAAAAKDRRPSFRRASFSQPRRRGNSSTGGAPSHAVVTDATAPPALPDYALAAAAKIVPRDRDWDRDRAGSSAAPDASEPLMSPASPEASFSRVLSRTATSMTAQGMMMPPPPTPGPGAPPGSSGSMYQRSEASMMFQQMTDLANKRISTLDYLRKAHEGRVYWFNTYLFDKPDLHRMPYFNPSKLPRKATNYLLLGLSLPTITDLYASTPVEFLRSLNILLAEFDSFQQLHGDSSTGLTRARLPNMFRRQGGKGRRSTSAADVSIDDGGANLPGGAGAAPAVMNFAASESDLLPGEEYTHLLTPSLPFDPDFFETFATLCDVLIDCYTRFLTLVPTPRECTAPIAELFAKADARVRKIIVQGVVKEFEDHSRMHIKTEVASIGKVVLGGLM